MALMETLQDDFSSGTIDTVKWTNVTSGVSIVSGQLQIVDSTGAYPFCSSAGSYDIRNSYALAKVTPAPRTGGNSQQTYFVYYASSGNGVGLAVGDTTLYKVVFSGGTETDTAIATYNATTHAWWRIRHNGTNIVLGWSSDGSTWTEGTAFSPGWTYTTTGWLYLNAGRWQAGDTATAYFDNVNITSTFKTGSDTASGTDNVGTRVGMYTGSDTATGTSSSGAIKWTGSDTASGTDSAGSLAATATGSDTATGTESTGTTKLGGSDTATGTSSAGSIAATASSSDSATGTSSAGSLAATATGSDTAAGTETVVGVIVPKSDSDTATGTDSAGTIGVFFFKSDADSASSAEGNTVLTPGNFTQIPSPKTWTNGDDLRAGTLNKEWRDTFSWVLRKTSPAFEGYNFDGASFTYSANVAIALQYVTLNRGNVTHASNATKVYVWETGWYVVTVQVGANVASATGTNFSSVLKVNGLVETTRDLTRTAGGNIGAEHHSSVYLTAGDYLEIALGGSWTGTVTGVGSWDMYPFLNLWWRNK